MLNLQAESCISFQKNNDLDEWEYTQTNVNTTKCTI